MKKLLTGAAISAVMVLTAAPALADRGHGHGNGHDKHHWKQSQHFHHYAPPRYVVRRDVHHYYPQTYYAPAYAPVPVYRPSPGVQVILPNIYIPLR
jgi:hypothetical protein